MTTRSGQQNSTPWQPWQELTILPKRTREWIEAPEKANPWVMVAESAKNIIRYPKFRTLRTKATFTLVKTTPQALGVTSPYLRAVCERAFEVGLALCPPEVGPEAEPTAHNSFHWVATRPMIGWNKMAYWFEWERDSDGKMLAANYPKEGAEGLLRCEMVFVAQGRGVPPPSREELALF